MVNQHKQPTEQVIRLGGLGLFTGLLPLITIHTTYLVSAWQGHVDWCIPYWHACTSVSATGRSGISYFIFKGAMIPAIVLMTLFWIINHRWLQALGYPRGKGVGWLGAAAGAFLLIYVLSLGHAGDGFQLARDIGTAGYVGMTGIAQILLGAVLWRSDYPLLVRGGGRLLRLSALTLGIAIVSLILEALPAVDYGEINHAFDWTLIVLLNIHGIGVALLWQKAGLAVTMPDTMNLK